MTNNLILSPKIIAPVYNPIVAVLSATTSAATANGFSYVLKIKDASTNAVLNTKRLPADPKGLGVFDISRLLQTKVSNNIQPQLYNIQKNTVNNYEYKLEYGSEHYNNWKFDNIGVISNNIYSGYTNLISSGSTNTYAPGDYITVNDNSTYYNGSHMVLSAFTFFGLYFTYINKKYQPPTVLTGNTVNSNGSKNYQSGGTSSNYIAFNSALKFDIYQSYLAESYFLDTTYIGRFLTSLPYTTDPNEMYSIELDQEMVVNGYVPSTAYTADISVRTYNKNMQQIGVYKITGAIQSGFVQIGIGTHNIEYASKTIIIGTPTVFNDSVYYYSVGTTSGGFDTSQKLYLKIKKECSKHEKWNIIFSDLFGSYIPFKFNFSAKRTVNINRKDVTRLIGHYDSSINQYVIDTNEREKSTIASTYNETVTVNSGWITENESEFLKELFVSNDAYLNNNDQWKAVNITNTSYEIKTTAKERLFNIQLTFTYSVTDRAQSAI